MKKYFQNVCYVLSRIIDHALRDMYIHQNIYKLEKDR